MAKLLLAAMTFASHPTMMIILENLCQSNQFIIYCELIVWWLSRVDEGQQVLG